MPVLNAKTKFIIEKLSKSAIWEAVDENLIPLLNEINNLPGMTSDVCCEGHEASDPYIYVTIAGTTESLESLGKLTKAAELNHWLVISQLISNGHSFDSYFLITPFEALRSASSIISLMKKKDSYQIIF